MWLLVQEQAIFPTGCLYHYKYICLHGESDSDDMKHLSQIYIVWGIIIGSEYTIRFGTICISNSKMKMDQMATIAAFGIQSIPPAENKKIWDSYTILEAYGNYISQFKLSTQN